ARPPSHSAVGERTALAGLASRTLEGWTASGTAEAASTERYTAARTAEEDHAVSARVGGSVTFAACGMRLRVPRSTRDGGRSGNDPNPRSHRGLEILRFDRQDRIEPRDAEHLAHRPDRARDVHRSTDSAQLAVSVDEAANARRVDVRHPRDIESDLAKI